jgi:hypothetical protein
VELKTAITSGEKRTSLQDPQEDPRAGICEGSKRDLQWVSENEEMDLVERVTPNERKKRVHAQSRSRKCGSTSHSEQFCSTKKKKLMLETYQGAAQDERP